MEINELGQLAIELMDALKDKKLGEVEIKLGDARITVKAAKPTPVIASTQQAAASAAPAAQAVAAETAAPAEELPAGTPVEAPLVGVFYSSPAPDAPPFVLVGQKVKKGDTLFIIEAMKTMNEIKSPCDGTVVRILAQPGDMVEYHQTVVVIEE